MSIYKPTIIPHSIRYAEMALIGMKVIMPIFNIIFRALQKIDLYLVDNSLKYPLKERLIKCKVSQSLRFLTFFAFHFHSYALVSFMLFYINGILLLLFSIYLGGVFLKIVLMDVG